jgi:cell shape-determining protein MreC
VKAGDRVVTSGASGEFPRGLEVGAVFQDGEVVRVTTAGSLMAGHYLTVLNFALPSSVARAEVGAARKAPAAPVRGIVGKEKSGP